MEKILTLLKREWSYVLGVRLSRRAWLIMTVMSALIGWSLLLKIGPNDKGARDFAYQFVGENYGFPIANYVGDAPPTVKIYTTITSYSEDTDKKGGLYSIKFKHITQDGPQIIVIRGELRCHYDTPSKKLALVASTVSK